MINTVSVGIVFVTSPNPNFSISSAEKTFVLAEVQNGLNALAAMEPRANLSWHIQNITANLPAYTPPAPNWPGLTDLFNQGIDDAVWNGAERKFYFFRGSQCIRFDPVNWRADPGYPQPIATNFPGLPANFQAGIDAAAWGGDVSAGRNIFFFKGSDYLSFDPYTRTVDSNWPRPIGYDWTGVPANFAAGIDAALWSAKNLKWYFFKGSDYLAFDYRNQNVDPGFPKPIAGNWKGFPKDFEEGIDAALYDGRNRDFYFFKMKHPINQYVRFRLRGSSGIYWRVRAGYPRAVGFGPEVEDTWRDPALQGLGFPKGADGITQLSDQLQSVAGAQYGYVAFFTKMPTHWLGYAHESTRKVVMRATSGTFDSFFQNSLDNIFAHETGHIFGALDEYAASRCTCIERAGKFFSEVNGNCEPCAAGPVSCLMKFNDLSMTCKFTPAHIGWADFLVKIDAGLHNFVRGKAYLFQGEHYARYPGMLGPMEADWPRKIATHWPTIPANFQTGIDAALWSPQNQKIYLFKGNQCIRTDPVPYNLDPGYPKQIAAEFPGLPANFQTGIDAALWSPYNRKAYFFKGNEYLRADPYNAWTVDLEFPIQIDFLSGDFATGIDAALWGEVNQRIYFFKGHDYVRLNPTNWQVEANYPRKINNNWMPFPTR
jgi:hypothetical protein